MKYFVKTIDKYAIPFDDDFISSSEEFETLEDAIKNAKVLCDSFFSRNYYNGQSGNGTDDYGFLGLPGGMRSFDGVFYSFGNSGDWWSSSHSNANDVWALRLVWSQDESFFVDHSKRSGFSVRCLRD